MNRLKEWLKYQVRVRLALAGTYFTFFVMIVIMPIAANADEDSSAKFAIPDIPSEWFDYVKYRNDYWSFGAGLAALLDYTSFSQSQESVEQIGDQEDEFEARSLRLMFGGTLNFIGPVSYLAAAEYKGFNRDHDDPLFNITDLSLSWKFQNRSDLITFGKQKEPFIYEMVGDAGNLPHHERFLEPFFRARNTGIRYTTNYLDHRLGLSLGWYNDWWHTTGDFSDNGNQLVARLTGLPLWQDNGARLLHLAVAARYNEADNNEADDDVLRYRGRPGSHVSDFYVDSGNIPARHAWQMGLETLWQSNNFTVLTEYTKAWVASQEAGDPAFWGWYVTTSYILNGDLRPYDQSYGYSRRVKPYTVWGALEPVMRYGYVDLDDGGIQGGKMEKLYFGLNWWATRRWKTSVGYGLIDLNRFGTTETTEQVLLRLQWVGIF